MFGRINYRHGDVLLVPIAVLPKDVKPVEGPFTLTGPDGHKHSLECKVFKKTSTPDTTYVFVEHKSKLMHDEHPIVEVEPGPYEVDNTQNNDYAGSLTRVGGFD